MTDLTPEGCYECRCWECGHPFVGHKREVVCPRCRRRPWVSPEMTALILVLLVCLGVTFGALILRIAGIVSWPWWTVCAPPVALTAANVWSFRLMFKGVR